MKKTLLAVALAVTLGTPVQAADVFVISGTVNEGLVTEQDSSASYKKIEDLVDSLTGDNLSRVFTSYTDNSAVNVVLNVRNPQTPINITVAAGSNNIVMTIPALNNYMREFTGATRDIAQGQLEDFLKANTDDILKKLLQKAVEQTPIDPVAGNPNSLLANMGVADFTMGTDFGTTGLEDVRVDPSSDNSFGIGLRFGRYSAGDYDQDVLNLPLSYTYRFESDPRRQLLFDLPLSYADVQGSKSYGASLGIGYRHPVNDDWSLTPAIRAGGVGSVDLGSAALVYSGSLTSNYNLYWDDIKISIGNMVGYYKTTSVDAGDFEVDYDLTNTMFKNGVGFEGPVNYTIFGNPTSWQFSVAHTLFTGDSLYVDSYFDIAASFGTRATSSTWDRIRLGLTYTAGNNSFSGFQVNFGYTF